MVQDFEQLINSDAELHTGRDAAKIKVNKNIFILFASVIIVTVLVAGGLTALHLRSKRTLKVVSGPPEQYDHRLKILPQNCGQRTKQSEFPWMAEIYFKNEKGWEHAIIVGTLISKRFVLTPAYKYLRDNADTRVLLGESTVIHNVDDGYFENRTYRDVIREESIIPDLFRPAARRHNLALLRLDGDVEFNDRIQPICLPAIHKSSSEKTWSQQFDILPDAEEYRKSTVKVVQFSKCADEWSFYGFFNEREDSHVCVQLIGTGQPCYGLEGSPLMAVVDVNGVQRAVEYGFKYFGDCTDGLQIYTNVSYHMEWILDHIMP